MATFSIRSFHPEGEEALIDLWKSCGLVVPPNDPREVIERKLKVNPELFLVGEIDGDLIASCMAGYEGRRGWINYLAVHPDFQRLGYATKLMDEAEARLKAMGCPKINLQIRTSNTSVIAFYESIGYLQDEVVSFGKRLASDDSSETDEVPNPDN